ncbi:glycosyltransferase family 4 protein [Pseudarthrobacter defluvii]|uniref:glycosyltransferase family 4 protein n=1 Tax=Pseudarthrobacter defluvii TaxID=410837 RepID=UPI0027D7AB5A|nr:glycosyltransferase [Pseudarthrobacter defluvii]
MRKLTKANWTIYVLGQPYPVEGQTGRLKRIVWKYLWLYSARKADRIVAVSDYISRIISRDIRNREIETVYPSLSDHQDLANSVQRTASKRLRVGFVGRLSPEKDPALFCSILGDFPEVDAKIYGDGPLRPQVEKVLNAVELAGFRPQREIYSALDVLMMTSQSEGLPMVLVEASLTGVVPLVCDIGGCAEAIHPDNRELLVIPTAERRNVSLWRSRLKVLQDSDTLKAAADLQKQWAEQNFDAKVNSEALASLLLGGA